MLTLQIYHMGHYTCTEIEKVKPELDFMDPLPIYINSEETFIYSKLNKYWK